MNKFDKICPFFEQNKDLKTSLVVLLAPKPRFVSKPGKNTIFAHKILTSPGYYLLSNKRSVVVCTGNLMHYCVATGVKVLPYSETITRAQTPNCSHLAHVSGLFRHNYRH